MPRLFVGILTLATMLSTHGVLPTASARPTSRSMEVVGASTARRVVVTGVVFDSSAGRPLEGALVQIVERGNVARSLSARTDTQGRFSFDSVSQGRYAVGFLHPRLDSLRLTAPVVNVDVGAASIPAVKLFVPSSRLLVRAHCGRQAAEDSSALFLGQVRTAAGGAALRNATVRIRWTEIVIQRGLRRSVASAETKTGDDGAFAICGPPAGARLLVQALAARDTSGLLELEVPETGVLVRDVHMGSYERVVVAAGTAGDSLPPSADADSVSVLRGGGRVSGIVRGVGSLPLAGVRLRVRDGATESVSDSAGRFTLVSLPTGTRSLEASSIGYQPLRTVVDIVEGQGPQVELVMHRFDALLDTVRVFASATVDRAMAGFENRRKQGLGRFYDEQYMARRDPMLVVDMLRTVPGITVQYNRSAANLLMRTGTGTDGYCAPNIYVDGVPRALMGSSIDDIVSAREVRAVEVYRSARLAPSEFQPMGDCGFIILWTGMRALPKRK